MNTKAGRFMGFSADMGQANDSFWRAGFVPLGFPSHINTFPIETAWGQGPFPFVTTYVDHRPRRAILGQRSLGQQCPFSSSVDLPPPSPGQAAPTQPISPAAPVIAVLGLGALALYWAGVI